MGLIDTINKLLRREQPATTADPPPASPTPSQGVYSSLYDRFQMEGGRMERVEQSRKMYDEDTRSKGIMRTLAADATKGGFQLKADNDQALEAAEALRVRLGLNKRLDDWARLTFRDGDSFIELGVTNEREIAVVTRKPTLNMRRNSDNTDRFQDPTKAYWYARNQMDMAPSTAALWFAEWQIVHARWDHDEGNRYGRPLMSSGQKAFKRISEGEVDVAVRRKTRSGIRYHHVVEGDEADIDAYIATNKDALNNPMVAQADFFSNKPGGITAIAGDGNLGSIDDITHHIETWWIESPVPRALLGYGRDLNRDVLREQKAQYDESLGSVREWIEDQLIVPILETQWLLIGIVPEMMEYSLAWETKKIVTPDDILKIGQAAQVLRGLGIPEEAIVIVMAQFLPGVDPDMLELAAGGNTADAARLAQIEAQLRGQIQ